MFLGVHVSTTATTLATRMTSSSIPSKSKCSGGAGSEEPPGDTVEWGTISCEQLTDILDEEADKMLVIDSRSFLEYNTSHIKYSVNICCSKLVKRRLQHDKVTIKDLLAQTCHLDPEEYYDIIVYDQCSSGASHLSADCFLFVLLNKLVKVFNKVKLLEGGFLNFQASHPSLCESKSTCSTSGGNYKCTPLTSMSQPCMPVSNVGPTKILPFLYLGSQKDALSQDTLKQYGVGYVLNISTTCPRPQHINENHFHRIPVNDNYSDKLLPHFTDAFQFIDKVREANGCVLVHCLAGISRSPTVAIAYVMKHLKSSSEEAYRYVKDKRPTISPNFNFLGQLMEFEKQMKANHNQPAALVTADSVTESSTLGGAIRKDAFAFSSTITPGMKRSFSLHLQPTNDTPIIVQSPTTALARLNFNSAPSPIEEKAGEVPTPAPTHLNFPQLPTTSLDQLSFTPCFTKEELAVQSASVNHTRHPSGNNNNNSKTTGGTKRPLSISGMDSVNDCDPCSGTRQNSSGDKMKCVASQVVCRSPESRAKRPLVRPNSIAFSSYPKFDFGTEHSHTSVSVTPVTDAVSPLRDLGCVPGSVCEDNKVDSSRPTFIEQVTNMEGSVSQTHPKDQSSSKNLARKSQSLEDILNSQADEEAAEWNSPGSRNKKGKHSHRTIHAADLFSQPVALDRLQGRCRGPSDPHQSSSSISSSGSHNSLQGSLEMIPVS